MSWIEETHPEDAEGQLEEVYRRLSRGGRVANIYAVQSLHPAAMSDHASLYRTLMFGPSPLTRMERESLAVEVSRANGCHY